MSQGSLEKSFVFRLNDNGLGPELIRQVFLEKGWSEFDEDVHQDFDWNLWWKTSRFRNSDYDQLQPWQRLNHYPKTTAITKKDCLARNLKRMKGVHGPSVYNFSPLAFNLPNDYTRFVAEYTKQKEKSSNKVQYWICKPADLSRGRGIFIFKDLSELQYDCNAVLQQYITNPLLISGYKFDLRIYVMVPSFHPLQIYIYEEGLVRFSTEKYDLSTLKNMYAHLTNTSINKHSPSYTSDKERVGPGCKWTITQLRHYFRQSNIDDIQVWGKIINLVILTVIIQANQVPTVSNCFEMYGFDVMLDENLKPWLLEVNFSPALSSDCHTDILVKKPLLNDTLDMLSFREEEKERGGEAFRQRQIYKAYGSNSQYKHDHRARSEYKKPATARLPNIAKSNSAVTIQGSAESDAAVDVEVVPIVPGCGLPSVQQPLVSRPPSSSACSSGSSDDGLDVLHSSSQHTKTMRQVNMYSSNQGHPVPAHKQISNHCRIASKRYNNSPYRSSNCNVNQGLRAEGQTGKKYPFYKRDSKYSVQSDSGISSHSGSSDNSDTHLTYGEDGHSVPKRKPTRRDAYHVRSVTGEGQSGNTSSSPGGGHRRAYAGSALVSSRIATARSTSRSVDAGGSTSVVRSVHHLSKHKVSTSAAYDNFARKSGILRTVQRQDKLSVRSQTTRPWTRTKPTTAKRVEEMNNQNSNGTPRVGTRQPPLKVGNFILVFPFSDLMRKSSVSNHGNLDMKVIIRECQKVLKDRGRAMGSGAQDAMDTEDGNHGSRENFNVPWLWAPQNEHGTTS